MLTVYTAPTANCQRVTVMLELTGLPYRHHRVDRSKGELRSADFLAMNPTGLVPVLIDDDGGRQVVAQSGAILLYLAEKAGKFLPAKGPQRASALTWFMQVMTDVNPTSSLYFLSKKTFAANPETKEFLTQRLLKFIGDCDRVLAGSTYLAGELSIADIALYPVIQARQDLLAGRSEFPSLLRWQRALAELPGVAKGIEVA